MHSGNAWCLWINKQQPVDPHTTLILENAQLRDRVAELERALLSAQAVVSHAALNDAEQTAPLREENRYLAALHETALALINRLDLDDALFAIVHHATKLFGTPDGYIYLVCDDEPVLEVKIGIGVFAGYKGFRIQPNEGLSGKVWQSGQPMVVLEYDHWPERTPRLPAGRFHSILAVPLRSSQQILGVLGISLAEPLTEHTQQRPISILERFAHLAAFAIENARMFSVSSTKLSNGSAPPLPSLNVNKNCASSTKRPTTRHRNSICSARCARSLRAPSIHPLSFAA